MKTPLTSPQCSNTSRPSWRRPLRRSPATGARAQGPELLQALAADGRLHLSVLTGNIAPNAVVKLAAFGLDKWLDLETGAYGSDHEDRQQLVPIRASAWPLFEVLVWLPTKRG